MLPKRTRFDRTVLPKGESLDDVASLNRLATRHLEAAVELLGRAPLNNNDRATAEAHLDRYRRITGDLHFCLCLSIE